MREILVVTYTVAATEELRHRIRQTLAKALQAFTTGASDDPFLRALLTRHADQRADLAARLDRALYGFDEAPIYTIHGFCQRVLGTGRSRPATCSTPSWSRTRRRCCASCRGLLAQAVLSRGQDSRHLCLEERLEPRGPAAAGANQPASPVPQAAFARGRPDARLAGRGPGGGLQLPCAKSGARRRTTIRGHFGSGAKWANKPYNDDEAMAEAFRQLDACLGAPGVSALRVGRLADCSEVGHCAEGLQEGQASGAERIPSSICATSWPARRSTTSSASSSARCSYVAAGAAARRKERAEDPVLRRPADAAAQRVGGRSRRPALAALLRRQYRAALIDEFQDTDRLQYDIFSRVFTGPENYLFLIGDPKQAIYGFRGADIFTYLKPASSPTRPTPSRRTGARSRGWCARSTRCSALRPSRSCSRASSSRPVEAKGEADKKPLKVDGQRPPAFQIWFWRRTGAEINKGAADKLLPCAGGRGDCQAAQRRRQPGRPQAAAGRHRRAGAREPPGPVGPGRAQPAQRPERALHQRQPV